MNEKGRLEHLLTQCANVSVLAVAVFVLFHCLFLSFVFCGPFITINSVMLLSVFEITDTLSRDIKRS